MRRLAGESGPESVAFAITTPSGTAMSDSIQWVERLMHAFGSPNNCYGTEICNWHKDVATTYTYGTSIGTPDWEHAGCALLWGHNPGTSWIAQARQVADAHARGAKLVVIDPRRAGAANKADLWLRVRPGTDGALALGIARVVLEEGWYDRNFVRDLTNAPCLVHQTESRLLRESDLVAGGAPDRYVVWNTHAERAQTAPRAPLHGAPWALEGEVTVATREGPVRCRPVLDAYRLRVGFEITQAANGRVQLRPPVVASRGESRDDGWIAFALAERLGLGNRFWNGNRDAGYREWLAPSGIDLDTLRERPEGVDVELEAPYAKHERDGFPTPSGRIEIWSETFRRHGYCALPAFEPPALGPRARPDLTSRYPLVLTTTKPHMYCHGQHRNLSRLRKLQPHPGVEMHPDTAATRAIADGDWVEIETPAGRVRARASLKSALAPDVVAAQHGWWQACRELDLPGYPVLGEATANLNAAVGAEHADPISGSLPLRSYVCEVRRSG